MAHATEQPDIDRDLSGRLDDHIETQKNPSLFIRVANWTSAAIGRPTNFIVWVVIITAWTCIFAFGNQHMASGAWLPTWFTSTGFNFPLNLVTTVLEMFLAFLIAAAANRTQDALTILLEHIRTGVDRDYAMETKLATLMQENTELTQQVKRDTALLEEIHRHVTALSPGAGQFAPDGK